MTGLEKSGRLSLDRDLGLTPLFLAGCASTGEWRALNIDGSSETEFGESLARQNNELSYSRGQMLALALVDIANTRVLSAGEPDDGGPAYTDEQFRRDLDGLSYEGVIALADESGLPIKTLYHARFWGDTQTVVYRSMSLNDRPFPVNPAPPVYQDTHSGYIWPTSP